MSNVRCWNCKQDFEVVSSAANSRLTAPIIEELLLANMFDGERGGMVCMEVDDLVYEVAQIITDYLEQ